MKQPKILLVFLCVCIGAGASYAATPSALNHAPADGAQRQGQDVALTWETLDAEGSVTYRVYLSDDPNVVDPNSPDYTGLEYATTSDTVYAPPAPLQPAALYYWRVAVYADNGVSVGDMLTFETGGDIVGIWPDDGAAGVATDLTITWSGEAAGAAYIDGYDVYFGETLPVSPTESAGENQWQTPELTDNTTYQFQIVSKHEDVVVLEGPVYSFTTGAILGHWTLDSVDCLDEIAGHHGQVVVKEAGVSDPNIGEGVVGDAIWFNGSNLFKIPGQSEGYWDPTYTSLTVSCWVKWDYATATNNNNKWRAWVSKFGEDGKGWQYRNHGTNGISTLTMRGTSGPDEAAYYPYIDDGVWNHLVATYDGKVKRWYVNGVMEYQNSDSGLIAATNASVAIGGRMSDSDVFHSSNNSFEGWVDDVRIYSRAFSPDQVTEAYMADGEVPKTPTPATGAEGIAWDTILEWEYASDLATEHRLVFSANGNLSDPLVDTVLTTDARRFDLIGALGDYLSLETEYFWQITSVLPDKTLYGPIWTFTVRDLITDLDGDLDVDAVDLGMLTDKWLNDSKEFPPAEYPCLDQEIWGYDPNLDDYVDFATGGNWSTNIVTLKTNPTPGDENYTPPSQTVLWEMLGDKGQHLMVLYLPEEFNFNYWDTWGFWVYQRDCAGGGQNRVCSASGSWYMRPFDSNYASNNDKWTKYEFDITANAPAVAYFNLWRGNSEASSEEFGNFFVAKDDQTVELCFKFIPEDLNRDCLVDLDDFIEQSSDWLLDANY